MASTLTSMAVLHSLCTACPLEMSVIRVIDIEPPEVTSTAPPREYPPDYPDTAKSVDPRRPGVAGGLPTNPPPVRLLGAKDESWPILIAHEEYLIQVWAIQQPHIMSMAFLPDGSLMIAERRGKVRLLRDGVPDAEALYEVPNVHFHGDCRLMSLCLHPEFATNKFVYIYYGDSKAKDCRIIRLRMDGKALIDPKIILDAIPLHEYHSGGIIRFGPDNKLYASTGDCWNNVTAQDPMHLGGKFLRIKDDGSIPTDNPFLQRAGYRPELYALGSRNAQGMDWQPVSGALFATEHGPSGEKNIRPPSGASDEFNLVTPGCNLGWPVIHADYEQEGMVMPLINFTNTIAPGSGMFYTVNATPALTGSYFVGCLRGHALMRIELDGTTPTDWYSVTEELGRIRSLAQGPLDFSLEDRFAKDNLVLYFASSNTDRYGGKGTLEDRIFRLLPAKRHPNR